jgi:hypothetical protein
MTNLAAQHTLGIFIFSPRLNPGAESNQTSLKEGSLETLLERGLGRFSPWIYPWVIKEIQ